MKNSVAIFVSLLLMMGAISCVPGNKYRTLQDTSRLYMNERDEFKTENISLGMANRELEAKMTVLEKQLGTINEDLLKAQAERDRALDDFNKISSKYTELQNAQEDLIRGNVKETQALISELQAAQKDLQEKEALMRQLEQNLDSKKASLDELSFELEKRNARLVELEKILDAQKRIAQDLKDKVSEALLGFENNGLTVTNRDGKVYVSLDEKLLFKSASWDIDANGRTALKKLAGVLERNPDIQVTIEGHTDNVPYRPSASELKDNWDLSVKRATTVVRVLLEGSSIDPKRLTAAGRSEYMPVDARNTSDARQKNRRTEVVLTPDLTRLYELINKY
ncbi:MAG TPA: OmpA family protein [Bacteroidales bacterium]|mgnify:FL=1|nr:OmpA family protein [Bacteroidales bacterium]HPF01693.1 OmpA family protein [Bacteroidales bacterium]HPJ58702.1 OmpA family protein [Bacteroidales bacterium]HPR12389.1 OmpA family protein [Bacteroidales bacterium]HRW84609.1 OmpA family protein [Bacteroidales bacterium]